MKHRTGHLRKRGSNFYVRWVVEGKVFERALRDENGHTITDKRKAEQARAKAMAPFVIADEAQSLESIAARLEGRRAELGRLSAEQSPPLPLVTAWSDFLKAPNRPDSGRSTLRQYEFQFTAFARWIEEKHPAIAALRQVTKDIAESYASHLIASGFSPNTYNKHLNLLALVFRVLKGKARLTENPWTDIQRKRLTTQTRRELTIEELKKVCAAAGGELRVLFGVGIYTGLRLGDCATLRWAECDLTRRVILRVPNKTSRSRPDKTVLVPIHPVLQGMLSEIQAEGRKDYVLPGLAELYQKRIDAVTDLIQQHFIACGINPHKPGTGTNGKRAVVEVGFHSLRHTFVSLCRESNAPLSVVESIVGHSNPAMTRHYTHVGELAAGRAVAALPSLVEQSGTTPKAERLPEAEISSKIRKGLENMTPENWQEIRDELLTFVSSM